MNLYLSDCCNVQATKEPLIKPKDKETATKQGLGKWTCGQCHKGCKVKRVTKMENKNEN